MQAIPCVVFPFTIAMVMSVAYTVSDLVNEEVNVTHKAFTWQICRVLSLKGKGNKRSATWIKRIATALLNKKYWRK